MHFKSTWELVLTKKKELVMIGTDRANIILLRLASFFVVIHFLNERVQQKFLF